MVDHVPLQWSAEDLATVGDLAGAAEVELALRLANSELMLASTRTQAVLDSAADAFVSLDAAGTVLAWNLAAERMFGRSAAETLGRPVGTVVADEFRGEFAGWLAGAAGSGSAVTLEVTAVDRAGQRFPIEVIAQVHVERDRPVIHAFVHDLSNRHAAHRQLEAERTFQRALLDSLDTAVVACDSAGRLATVNRAFRDATRACRWSRPRSSPGPSSSSCSPRTAGGCCGRTRCRSPARSPVSTSTPRSWSSAGPAAGSGGSCATAGRSTPRTVSGSARSWRCTTSPTRARPSGSGTRSSPSRRR